MVSHLFCLFHRPSLKRNFYYKKFFVKFLSQNRPSIDWERSVLVKFRPIINQILAVSEVNQKIDIKLWFLHEWSDQRLIWNPEDFAGIKFLHIPADQ